MQDYPKAENVFPEKALLNNPQTFSSVYMTTARLHNILIARPDLASGDTITALEKTLACRDYISQKKALFLYREAAEALTVIAANAYDAAPGARALNILKKMLASDDDAPHQAAAEAVANLPLNIAGPRLNPLPLSKVKKVSRKDILKAATVSPETEMKRLGRSFVFSASDTGHVTTVKTASDPDQTVLLLNEICWMQYLKNRTPSHMPFDIPEPVKIDGHQLFQMRVPETGHDCFAIVFRVSRRYFQYPNDHRSGRMPNQTALKKTIAQNAMLFGMLTRMGIIHTAPIPLFHNRVQQNRRADSGIYDWTLGGRLDRWLFSSRYPNFGMSGIRDFEHFISFNGNGRDLYKHIGTQLLSLILVCGSYFRNKAPGEFGLTPAGAPVDQRHLFDFHLLRDLLNTIVGAYYEGFTGHPLVETPPVNFDHLTHRMIEEMGMDRHMEEILRHRDQQNMSDDEIESYLSACQDPRCNPGRRRDAGADIIVWTGPHLGRFNGRTSLPELTTFLETVSAACIAGCFENKNKT